MDIRRSPVLPTALALLLTQPAWAGSQAAPQVISPVDSKTVKVQSGDSPVTDTFFQTIPHAITASGLIGKRVFVSADTPKVQGSTTTPANQTWDDIGKVSDVVIGMDGAVDAVLVNVGGYLGIGSRVIAISMNALRLIPDGVSQNAYFVVVKGDKAMLAKAPAYEGHGAESWSAVSETAGSAGKAAQPVPLSKLTPGMLGGTDVLGPDDNKVGTIVKLLPGTSGTPEGVVIDVGSFLGIGGKDIRIDANQITVLRSDQGYIVHTGFTASQLNKLGPWKG